jgi:hypothetical protein
MPDGEEFPSQMMMIQTYYMIFPIHHAVSNHVEAQSEGEGQQSLEIAALLAGEYHH